MRRVDIGLTAASPRKTGEDQPRWIRTVVYLPGLAPRADVIVRFGVSSRVIAVLADPDSIEIVRRKYLLSVVIV